MDTTIRSWTFIMAMLIPLCGFGAVARTYVGTVNVSCASASPGFQLTVQNTATGATSALHIPLGACPTS
ncbi:MAG TPA: hypothetical protein VF898_10495 [Chloroflexota bacterium]